MSDPIADMLTRIRNGYLAGLSSVEVPTSRLKRELAELLSREGWIGKVEGKKEARTFTINLRYQSGLPAAEHIRRISKPGLRVYRKTSELKPIRRGFGLIVLSTSKGLMTGTNARKNKMGGEVLVEIW
jgi:small subunit ribosomal protein S8